MAVDSNYVAFGEKAVLMVVDLYGMTAAEPCVVTGEILRQIIEVSDFKSVKLFFCIHYPRQPESVKKRRGFFFKHFFRTPRAFFCTRLKNKRNL